MKEEKKNKKKSRGLLLVVIGILCITIGFSVVFVPKKIKNFSYKSEPKKQEEKKEEEEKKKEEEPLYKRKAKEALEKMTLEEKIGQMLFSRVPETDALLEIDNYHFGGYILFGRDVNGETFESIKEKVDEFQKESKIPMFIGIDEEGGTVSRLSYAGLADFLSPQELFNQGGMELIKKDTEEKAEILGKIGVNVNFAPVADTCEDETAFIFNRSFGKNASETSKYVETSVKAYSKSGVLPTLKHFPGYGNNLDTHTGIAIDEREISEFRESDFLPFISGIKSGAEFIMVSHNIISKVDDTEPASISPQIHKILRDELKFDGIILTDDLAMDAIHEYYSGEYPAEVQAVLSGNTMILISDYSRGFSNILEYTSLGIIPEKLINEAVIKILEIKYKYLTY